MKEEFIKSIYRNSLFFQLSSILRDLNVETEDFYRAVEEKDNRVKKLLSPLFQFGMVTVLLPLDLLIHDQFDDSVQKWWAGIITELDQFSLIPLLQKLFEQDMRMEVGNPYHYISNSILEYADSVPGLNQMIWRSCSVLYPYFARTCDSFCMMGFLLPSVYLSYIDQNSLERIQQYAIPALCSAVPKDQYERAVLCEAVRGYAGEIFANYENKLRIFAGTAMRQSEETMNSMNSKEYRDLLFPEDGKYISTYLNEQWIRSLQSLDQQVRKYGIKDYSCTLLGKNLPLLLQFIGHDEEAEESLTEYWNNSNIRDRSDVRILAASYRTLSRLRYKKHIALLEAMDQTWKNGIFSKKLLQLNDDIMTFFDRYHEKLLQYSADPAFRNNKELSDWNWKIVYELLFKENRVNLYFEKQALVINDESIRPDLRIEAYDRFMALFHGLIANWNDYSPAIRLRESCALLMEGKCRSVITELAEKLFHVYTPGEAEELRHLIQREQEVKKTVPDLQAVIYYIIASGRFTEEQNVQVQIEELWKENEARKTEAHIHAAFDALTMSFMTSKDIMKENVIAYFLNNPNKVREFKRILQDLPDSSEAYTPLAKQNAVKLAEFLQNFTENASRYDDEMKQKKISEVYDHFITAMPVLGTLLEVSKGTKSLIEAVKPHKDPKKE